MDGTVIAFFMAAVMAAIIGTVIWDSRRRKRRRASLHQDSSGTWVWTDFDGSTRSSRTHPEEKGGDWYNEPGGGGYDGGSDGGGDGGGGGGD